MKLIQTLIASAALAASLSSNAAVLGTQGGGTGSFLALSSTSLGGIATVSGGTVYTTDQTFASNPNESGIALFGGNFLAAGPTSGTTANITFTAPTSYISFLWGSPDLYNQLTVTSSIGPAQTFTAASLGFPVTDGTQSFARYVQFSGVAGATITSLSFTNIPSVDAFEVANFSITPVPEPETYALMFAGLGALAFVAKRRKSA